MTDSERKLWSGLRACLDPKLIVELDGSQHADQASYDARREAFFRAQGFAILRFASNEPLLNPTGVLAVIVDQLATLAGGVPIPAFPQRGKEQIPRSPS